MAHHKLLSPSSFPMFSKCPCFSSEGSKPRDYSDEGVLKHELFANCLISNKLCEDENINWAFETVQEIFKNYYPNENFNTVDKLIEDTILIEDDNLNEISFGTADLIIKDILFDLKNGEPREYIKQLMMYGRGYMQSVGLKSMKVIEIYPRVRAIKEYSFTLEECIRETNRIISMVMNPNKTPNPNEYCKWCGVAATCSALNNHALSVASYIDESYKNKIDNWNPKNITDPEQLKILLKLWKTVLKPFGEAIEYQAKELAINNNILPNGYRLQIRKGNREVPDLEKLFKNTDLSPKDFLSCCKISLDPLREKLKLSKAKFDEWITPFCVNKPDVKTLVEKAE